MAKIEPVTGRYIYVPYEGEEYRMFYEEAGQGIPLVCLHTAGTDSREWRHQLCDSDINRNFRVIALISRVTANRFLPTVVERGVQADRQVLRRFRDGLLRELGPRSSR